MSVSQQLAIRIQNTIDSSLLQVARLSDVDTWIGPIAVVSHSDIKRINHLLSSCIDLLRSHHESSGL